MWRMMGGYGGMGFFGFGFVFMLLFWALVIFAIITLVRWASGEGMGCHHLRWKDEGKKNTPLDILKERYAKGEINKDEFEQKKKDLE